MPFRKCSPARFPLFCFLRFFFSSRDSILSSTYGLLNRQLFLSNGSEVLIQERESVQASIRIPYVEESKKQPTRSVLKQKTLDTNMSVQTVIYGTLHEWEKSGLKMNAENGFFDSKRLALAMPDLEKN